MPGSTGWIGYGRSPWIRGRGAPLLLGQGQTIGIAGETNLDSADIQKFRDEFGITALGPDGSVQVENPPSSVCAAPDPSHNDPEGYLDAEWSGAMAPEATVDFVACGGQGVTSGADLAAAYMIQDAAHAQRISVLSTSYGDCEAVPQTGSNEFYVSLWQQAAVEGITVVVASGDKGADGCRDVGAYATQGNTVVNDASTPYNIAAGGTDFSDVFSGTQETYWSAANGADYLSAQSYIPEMTWNDSCASPLVLERFGQSFTSSSGPNGFCTWAAQQPVDINSGFPPYFLCLRWERGAQRSIRAAALAEGGSGSPPAGWTGGSGHLDVCVGGQCMGANADFVRLCAGGSTGRARHAISRMQTMFSLTLVAVLRLLRRPLPASWP